MKGVYLRLVDSVDLRCFLERVRGKLRYCAVIFLGFRVFQILK